MNTHKQRFLLFTLTAIVFTSFSCTETVNSYKYARSAGDFLYNKADGPWLVLGDDPSHEVRVVWTVNGNRKDHSILFGDDPQDLVQVEAIDHKGKINSVLLQNLVSSKVYYYALPSSPKDILSFKLPATDGHLQFTVFGDMQPKTDISNMGNDIISAALARLDTDFFVQLGDITELGGVLKCWHNALSRISRFADDTPIAPAIGNHDYYLDPSGHNFRNFFPRNYPDKNAACYSLNIGKVHMLFLDNFDKSVKKGMTDSQMKWADKDLADSSCYSDWIFIFMHHTMLTTGTSSTNEKLRKWLVPLADKYGVDAVFFGHDHHYEHWYYTYGHDGLVYNQNDTPASHPVHYFCSGGGGAQSEVQYGLLDHEPIIEKRTYWDLNTGQWKPVEVIRSH
ncbi:MAG: metallophosphoesterase family protein [Spirochaetales bacterium]|nr:metallophosphoesterase family protein [Spirochaetales bacterium]